LGAMLSFSLGLRNFARHQRARTWITGAVEPIQGKTLLLLGLGRTGQALARRAKALGLTTLGVRAHPRPTADVDEVYGI
ncbi:MAG: D-2-hydroxyacid dehydrogenase, partial [Mesorhizobium sp.]